MASERHVIVAGAGIGGLTAALSLARAGFRVTVLEHEKWYQRGIIATITAGIIMLWEAIKVSNK